MRPRFTTRIAGEVRDFDPTRWVAPKDVKKMDAFIHYGVAASMMAMEDAGLDSRRGQRRAHRRR